MAEENSNDDVCDFLDTFFDDGVLEAIEDVLGNPQSTVNSDDSSCEALDTNVTNTTHGVHEATEKCLSASLESQLSKEGSEETCGNKDRIIILKPAHLKDPLQQPDSTSHKEICHDFPKKSTCSEAAGLEHVSNKCALPEKTVSLEAASQSQNLNDKTEESTIYSSMDQLLERVKKILKEVPVTEIKGNNGVKSQSSSLAQEKEKKDLVAMVKKCLADPPAFGLVTDKVTSANNSDDKQIIALSDFKDSESTVTGTELDATLSQTVIIEEECEILKSNAPSSSSVETSATKVCAETVAEVERDEQELSLEDMCSNELKQKSPEKQKKININLKTQILAPTSVLNPESSSKVKQSTSGSDKKKSDSSSSGYGKKKAEQSSSCRDKKKVEKSFPEPDKNRSIVKLSTVEERCLSLSSISNESLTDAITIRGKTDKRRRQRESSVSGSSDSSDCLRSKRKEEKKKKKKNDSPVGRRKREKSRKSKDSRRRSHSRPRSPHKTSKRRDRSPKSYRKRRRTFSRSPSPLGNHRFSRRLSRSPRHRSRSNSPVHYRTRKAKSPSDHRRKKSRSKSPFINEICRLKKQWEKEDEAKKDRYGQVQSEQYLPHLPSWTSGTNSTTIVSNISAISVSVESVQVHSASFSFGNSMDVPPGFSVGLSPEPASVPFGAHFRLPDHSIHHNGSPYPMSVASPPVFALPCPYDQGAAGCEVQPHPQICAPPPQMILPPPSVPGISSPSGSTPTISTEPPTSMLRKQLDILMTSVAPTLPEPVTSPGNNSPVQIAHQPKETSGNLSSEETGINVVPPSNPPLGGGAGEECIEPVKSEPKSLLGSEKHAGNEKPHIALNDAAHISSDRDLLGRHGVEEYDSDVIIEDPPPKAPIQLVCLSADEADNVCPLYDLDKELNKIDEDAEKLNQLKTGKAQANSKPLSKKKKKRKRKSKSKECPRNIENNAEIDCSGSRDKEVVILEDSTEISDDSSSDIILRECREMIDSLRIGRFVFIDDDETVDEAAAADTKDSNSVLYSSGVEFSYTKKPKLDLEPKTKSISTNTPIHLLIDVCCGTENNVVQKDFGVQTNSGCHGCTEKKDIIKELNTQLLTMKKERDHLLSIVIDIGSSSQKIPGLDIPSESQTGTGKGNRCSENQLLNPHLKNYRAFLNSIQSESNSWCIPNVRSTAVTHQDMQASGSHEPFLKERTMSVMSQIHETPTQPVFYDYNHSSPVPTEVQSHSGINEYLSPKTPFQ